MKKISFIKKLPIVFLFSFLFFSCDKESNTLAPYAGSPRLSDVIIQDASFKPKVTWVGGNVSVFGVNRGNKALLDTSLVWLIHTQGNNIGFPVVFGELPAGAQDITSQFGGVFQDSLQEDQKYTFWVLKEDVWNQVSTNSNKELTADSSSSSVVFSGDTLVMITPYSFAEADKSINVYINIIINQRLGGLADIFVESTTLNIPRISWKIKEAGKTDSTVAAIGISKGTNYDASGSLWEAYSISLDSTGAAVYARENVIAGPLLVGDSIPGTRVFVEFDPAALERNADYNIWIADKTWDREKRDRTAPGYSFVRFKVE